MDVTAIAFLSLMVVLVFLWKLIKNGSRTGSKKHPFYKEYFTGLNYLLNDEQGKALDVFVKLVENDWETIDTHFALGKIFRKNGEIDKAIKIHQGLIARPSLPERYKSKVLLELGYDYLGAGWLDRAEGLFKEVLIHDKQSVPARKHLIFIYQQEKDWYKAIATAEDLFREDPAHVGPMISQYYCELAELAKNKGDKRQVAYNANQALKYDSNSVRASILLAGMSMAEGNFKQALTYLKQVEKQDEEYLPSIMRNIIACYEELNNMADLLKYMEMIEEKHKKIFLLDVHAELIGKMKTNDEASNYLNQKLHVQPSLRGMHHLLEYQNADNASELVNALKYVSSNMLKDTALYKCKKCGYQTNTHHWLCPGCQSWGDVKPELAESV